MDNVLAKRLIVSSTLFALFTAGKNKTMCSRYEPGEIERVERNETNYTALDTKKVE